MTEARRAPRAANPIGTATRTKEAREKARARAKTRVKPDTATTVESRAHLSKLSILVGQQTRKIIKTSSWESEPDGENAEELASTTSMPPPR